MILVEGWIYLSGYLSVDGRIQQKKKKNGFPESKKIFGRFTCSLIYISHEIKIQKLHAFKDTFQT